MNAGSKLCPGATEPPTVAPFGQQKATGHGLRYLVETTTGHHKQIIDPKPEPGSSDDQQGDVLSPSGSAIAQSALPNRSPFARADPDLTGYGAIAMGGKRPHRVSVRGPERAWNTIRVDRLFAAGVLFGLYLLFAGTASATEIGAALATAALVTALATVLHRRQTRRLRLLPPATVLLRPLPGLVRDSGRVGMVLARAVARRPAGQVGEVVRQVFHQGGEDPADAGRRGMVVLAASLAPNGYVLHIPAGEDAMVMHRLAPVPPSPDRNWPT